ncbi:free fatty acid receptor 4-like [Hoplias malabaricus]|uniref:free fatty acid receptor 4-like n=1 Tax=Hoplias malabaricus TaxID=27720 RepID=UPI003461E686
MVFDSTKDPSIKMLLPRMLLLSTELRPRSILPHVYNVSHFSFFSELQDTHWSVTMVETLFQTAIFLVSVVSNISAFTLVLHEQRLVDNKLFTLNLFLADLLFVSTIPLIITVRWTKEWRLGSTACQIAMYFICMSGSVTIITLAAISVERLLAILRMETTPSLNLKKASGVLLLIWLLTVIAMLPVSLFSRVVTVISHEQKEMQICTLMWPHLRGEVIWNIAFLALGFLLPAISIVISYSKILKIRKHSRERLHGSATKSGFQACPVSKQDYKLFRTLLILMLSFFVMWSPIFIFTFLVLVRNLQVNIQITSTMFFWVVTFTMTNSALNPVLYSVYQLRHSWQKLCCAKEVAAG